MRELREQKLIDLCFSLCITMHLAKDDWVQRVTREEVAEWVSQQLEGCGFPTKPMGSSWGILVQKTRDEKLDSIRKTLEDAAIAIYEAGT